MKKSIKNRMGLGKDGYDWKFRSVGGTARVSIESGQDIAHLGELDRKLWTVLSMPTAGLQFDGETLSIMDSDNDGKIRVDEVIAASKWLAATLTDCEILIAGGDSISLSQLRSDTAEGQAALDAAKTVLGEKQSESISMSDLGACTAAYEARCKAAADEAAAKAAQAELPYGDKTDAAIAACDALKAKVADYFMRCRLIKFDSECSASLDVPVAKIGEIGSSDLSACADQIASFPIARPSESALLPLDGSINPAWQAQVAVIRETAVAKDFPGAESIDESQWNSIVAKLDAFKAARQTALSSNDDALGKDGAATKAAIELTSKLLHLRRDFFRLLQNYVILDDFYSRDHQAIFQEGKLFIDQRCCELCIKVSDMGKHGDMAGLSGMYLIYCSCSSKTTGKTMDIVAVLTDGDVKGLRVGKNAVFYDRNGNDYDAVVTKLIDNPISIRQAFWSPYRKFGQWCTEKINKMAADKESNAAAKLTQGAQQASDKAAADLASGAKPASQAFDIAKFAGIFAAIGMAIGYIGGFLTKLGEGLLGLGLYMPLAFVAIMLLISGPSMFIAWGKLRKRDLGPVLNANGWAINAKVLVNTRFGATLTSLAKFPILEFSGSDPYAQKKSKAGKWIAGIVALLIAAGAALYFTDSLKCIGLPFHKEDPKEMPLDDTTESAPEAPVQEEVAAPAE